MSGGDKVSGVAAVLDELIADARSPLDGNEAQDSLFDPADFEPDVPMPMAPVQRSGPQGGRPKGARNKSTEQLREYITSRYKHPLIVLAEMWSRTPAELAKDLELYDRQYFEGAEIACHLATGEAAKLQRDALIAALPYLAQKMPIAIEQKIRQMGVLLLGDFNAARKQLADGGLNIPNDDDAPIKLTSSPLGGDPE